TPNSIKNLYESAGLKVESLKGFPISIYPGMQETQISGSSEKVLELLENKKNFQRIYNIEKILYENESAASRGNNIYIIGQKH
ncbi:hypothetical protein HOA56_08680, partial [archaeon]|nr:hypothetical protein [archaeon]